MLVENCCDMVLGVILWNFGKFVVGKDGVVVVCFVPMIKFDDPVLFVVI